MTQSTLLSSHEAEKGSFRAGTAVIVGPGKHFGRELAQVFAGASEHVVLLGRDAQRLASQASGIANTSIQICDVANPGELQASLRAALVSRPPLRFVVYNVKQSTVAPALTLDPAELIESFTVNVAGALALIQEVTSLDSRYKPTSILLTGGGFKDHPDEQRLALSVAKAGLHNLTLGMAQGLLRKQVLLKTLVIDGIVRRDEALTPEAVASALLRLSLQPHLRVSRVAPPSTATDLQLPLFTD